MIHQDAWFHLGQFDADAAAIKKHQGNGIYAFVLAVPSTSEDKFSKTRRWFWVYGM